MKRAEFILIALLLLIFTGTRAYAFSSPDSLAIVRSPQIGDTIWSDVKSGVTDALLLFSAPARFGGRGWGVTGGVMAGTALATLADDPMRTGFATGHSGTKDQLRDVGNLMGTWLPTTAISGTLYLGGLLFDSPGVRVAGRRALQSVVYAVTISTVTKGLLGRERPFLNNGPYRFHGFSAKDDFNSMPSGHTTVSFALCSSLAAEIDNPWATTGLYGLATLTSLSRIYDDRHWFSDTFLGAAIGMACGYGVSHLHDATGDEKSGLLVLPTGNGLAAVWTF